MDKQTTNKDHNETPGKVIGKLSKIFDTILTVTAYLSGSLIVIMMLSISYEVVMRYFFNSPTIWVIDFSGYMQYAVVLLGAAWVLKNDGHSKIDVISNRFQGKKRLILSLLTCSIGLIACGLFFWKGLEATWGAYQRSEFLYRDVEVPTALLLVFFPLGFSMLFIQFAREIYNNLRALLSPHI
jgi:C4-dicarboxylate transporter DctQ subunit